MVRAGEDRYNIMMVVITLWLTGIYAQRLHKCPKLVISNYLHSNTQFEYNKLNNNLRKTWTRQWEFNKISNITRIKFLLNMKKI